MSADSFSENLLKPLFKQPPKGLISPALRAGEINPFRKIIQSIAD
jgi:hypothetical protein